MFESCSEMIDVKSKAAAVVVSRLKSGSISCIRSSLDQTNDLDVFRRSVLIANEGEKTINPSGGLIGAYIL